MVVRRARADGGPSRGEVLGIGTGTAGSAAGQVDLELPLTHPAAAALLRLLTRLDTSAAALRHAHEFVARDPAQWLLRGIAAFDAGELAEARRTFRVERGPKERDVCRLLLAQCSAREGDRSGAAAQLMALDLAQFHWLAWLVAPHVVEARKLLAR